MDAPRAATQTTPSPPHLPLEEMKEGQDNPSQATKSVIAGNIPQGLKALSQWVLWKQEVRDGKPTKIPYQAKGLRADSTEPRTWTTFSAAVNAYLKKPDQFNGIGFVFSAGDPYAGVDLDKCRDPKTGEIAPWAREILDQLNSYCEVSPSGTGIKVFVRGSLPRNEKGETRNRKGAIELYDCNRYFTLTGQRLEEYPATLEDRDAELQAIHAAIFTPPAPKKKEQPSPEPLSLSDEQIIQKAHRAKNGNGEKFSLLWAGDTSEYAGDDSAADLALCRTLAFWVGGDRAAIDRLFRQSGLYREKWEREDYRERTISKALEGMTEFYSPDKKKRRKRVEAEDGAISSKILWEKENRPEIEVAGGKLPEIVDQAEIILARAGGIYQRERLLVRAVRTARISPREGVRRAEGSLVIQLVEAPWLTEELTRLAVWKKWDARMEDFKEIDCPSKYPETLMARAQWGFPVLLGLIEAPTLRPDGSILDRPGYDKATGLLFDPNGVDFPAIPENPSMEEAKTALKVLDEILEEFPFEQPEDRSVALSTILTALVRRSLRTAPLHGFSAPKMRSGKSLLADIAAMIATGRPAAVMSQAENPEEEKKRLLALLMEGDPVVVIDNVEKPIKSDSLCSVLTQTSWKERLLGVNRTVTVPTSVTFLATGNNLVLAGDLSSRAMVCYIHPSEERPEEREFKLNLYEYIPEHRPDLVRAGLTALRAYHVEGRPKQEIKPWGGFEQWSDLVRSALVWCGRPDPCLTRRRVEEADTERGELGAFLREWYSALKNEGKTLAEVSKLVERKKGEDGEWCCLNEDLREVVLAVAGTKGEGIDTRKLAHFLRKFTNRKEGGLKLVKAGTRQGVALWAVKGQPEPLSGNSGGLGGLGGLDPTHAGKLSNEDALANGQGRSVDNFYRVGEIDPPNPPNPPKKPNNGSGRGSPGITALFYPCRECGRDVPAVEDPAYPDHFRTECPHSGLVLRSDLELKVEEAAR